MLLSFTKRVWDGRWGYIFLAPAYIPFLIFIAYPLVQGVWLSFYRAGLNRAKWRFIGLDHYVRLFTTDHVFQIALKNTFLFVLIVVPAVMIISLFIAVIIFPLKRNAQSFFRAALYLPVVSGGVILAGVWIYIFNRDYGLLNYVLDVLGVFKLLGSENIGWLGQPGTALLALSTVVISWTIGVPLILFLAGLGAIPEILYDAANIDGANVWQQFRKITLPLLRPTVLFVLVTTTINVFQIFVVVLMMTGGGPANATQTIMFRIYQHGFLFYKFGNASAMAVVLLIIIGTVAVGQFKLLDRQTDY